MLIHAISVVSVVCLVCGATFAEEPKDSVKKTVKRVIVPSEGVTEFTVTGRSTLFRLSASTIAGGNIAEPIIKGSVKHLGTAEIVEVGKDGRPLIGSLRREFMFRGTAAGKALIAIKKTMPTQPKPIVEEYTVTIK